MQFAKRREAITILSDDDARDLFSSTFNFAQLHMSRRLPRIIVPLFPRKSFNDQARDVDTISSGTKLKALKSLIGAWERFANKDLKMASFRRWTRRSGATTARRSRLSPIAREPRGQAP